MIIAHNHPSGDPTSSPEDVLVTRQIIEAGQLLDFDILDHLVIDRARWISMRERGLGFQPVLVHSTARQQWRAVLRFCQEYVFDANGKLVRLYSTKYPILHAPQLTCNSESAPAL